MDNLPEVFIGVNRYVDYTTMEEYFEYTPPTKKPGVAKSNATRQRHPNGKARSTKKIGNTFHYESQVGYGGRKYQAKVHDTFFEFVETWVMKVKEWERV